jgi:hypothetical protein
MYDRLLTSNKFARRPVVPSGPPEPIPPHEFGEPVRSKKAARRAAAEAKRAKKSANDT